MLMQNKLGLMQPNPALVKGLFEVMEKTGNDFTNTFRILSKIQKEDSLNEDVIVRLVG